MITLGSAVGHYLGQLRPLWQRNAFEKLDCAVRAHGSFVVRPHAQDANGFFLGEDFVNDAVLDVDSPRVSAC